jgi:hypothetical protein|tara:strand:- start:13941 stop:14129 length:189 start_codon:yes stop_codon:yes gene_type:complete
MTAFSDEFINKVQNFWFDGQKLKKSDNDKIFTIYHVMDKFNLTYAQVSRMVYLKPYYGKNTT